MDKSWEIEKTKLWLEMADETFMDSTEWLSITASKLTLEKAPEK